MERMTVKCDDRHWGLSFTVYDNAVPSRILEKLPIAIDRLAAYEDTGLEPEEVAQTKLALMGKALAEIKEFEGVPVNRMIELAQAEKDGRLVVLLPNDPLTLDELREMDGEPVWIEWGGHPQAGWALVRVWSKVNNVVYLTYHNGNTDLLGFVLNDGGKIYRRRLEED